MKPLNLIKLAVLSAFFATPLISCSDKKENTDTYQETAAGEVYDTTQQGVQHENRDNQFPESRNDNYEGNGLETGAASDTIDGDGDSKKPATPK